MKKFLAAWALILSVFGAQAAQPVFVVWPWGMGDTDVQFSRVVMEDMNRQQKDINFLFDNKPGAGASIAAMHVAKNNNSILAASSAFFVRPNFFTEGVHSMDDFKPLMLMCSGPLVLVSGKYRNLNEVPRDQVVNIGLGGLGTTSHLTAELLKSRFPQVTAVAYQNTNQPLIEAMAGRIDFAVGFIPAVEQFVDSGKLHAVGITGNKSVRGIPTLASQGLTNADLVVNHHSWLVNKNVPDDQFRKMQDLARTALRAPEIQEEFRKFYCEPRNLTGDAAGKWFVDQQKFWRDLSVKARANSK
jgi:tripartite-type tricarboxylate transporter receptor subunit TctC